MQISPSAATTDPQAQKQPAKNARDPAKTATDYKTFLKLLTTQLRNQDPLKPLDSTQFIAQLASFSAVEQQVRTNDSLGQIKTLLGGGDAGGLSSWIGLDVSAPRDVNFSGTPVKLYVSPATGADKVDLVVTNSTGAEVQRETISPKSGVASWAGVSANGTPLPPGRYSFSLESYQNSNLIATDTPPIYGNVVESRLNAGKTVLVLADGTIIPADNVTAVRGGNVASK